MPPTKPPHGAWGFVLNSPGFGGFILIFPGFGGIYHKLTFWGRLLADS